MVIVPTEKRFDWQHTPIVLIGIVLLNILVFFLYQSNDGFKFQRALETYQQANLLELEWELYQGFKKAKDSQVDYQRWQEKLKGAEDIERAVQVLLDGGFTRYLQENSRNLIGDANYHEWEATRARVNAEFSSMSTMRFGLMPGDIKASALFVHQFLHGGIMHLLGNLFFLIICGFAVEAAVGHFRFLLFYLLSGVVGGLSHALVSSDAYTPLVGASGAISGVMAMYLGVFRLKKIEFFYWFFIFVGYFRAPALLILPFYIGKELFYYFNEEGASVAFMAHAGGFVAGALLILGTFVVNRKLIDEDYVEEDQSIDPYREKLGKLYNAIENFRFKAALRATDSMLEEYGENFELLLIRYRLLKIDKGKGFQRALYKVLAYSGSSDAERLQQAKLWQENPEQQADFPDDNAMHLALSFANERQFALAEDIFKRFSNQAQQAQQEHPQLLLLAKRLAEVSKRLKQDARQAVYERYISQAR